MNLEVLQPEILSGIAPDTLKKQLQTKMLKLQVAMAKRV